MSSNTTPRPPAALVAALFTALLLALPSPAAAQSDAGAQAQRHSDLATKLFLERDYAAAIVEFYKAYEVQPAPLLLYNIAICYQSMGDAERAVSALTRALAHEDITPKEAAAATARLHALGVLALATQAREPEAGPLAATPEGAPGPTRAVRGDADSDQTPGWYTGLQWGALGAGALGLGAAVLINQSLSDDLSAYERAQAQRSATQAQADAIHADQRLGKGLLGAGLGLIAVGVGLWVLDPWSGEQGGGARLDVVITPEERSVWLTLPLP